MKQTLLMVINEIERCEAKYGVPHSTHESWGVIAEEWAELCEAIRANASSSIEREAVQVAACAMRLAEAVNRGESSFMVRSGLK